jgi:hypothetical protein
MLLFTCINEYYIIIQSLSHTLVTYPCHLPLSHTLVTYPCHIPLSHTLVTYPCHIPLSPQTIKNVITAILQILNYAVKPYMRSYTALSYYAVADYTIEKTDNFTNISKIVYPSLRNQLFQTFCKEVLKIF